MVGRRADPLERAARTLPGAGRGTRQAACLTGAATLLLLAGCGNARLSHTAYVEKADAICSAYRSHTPALRSPTTLSAYITYVERVIPPHRDALAQLERLRPPRADEALVARWLVRDRAVERDLRAIADAAHGHRLPDVEAGIARLQANGSRLDRLAATLGLRVCGRP